MEQTGPPIITLKEAQDICDLRNAEGINIDWDSRQKIYLIGGTDPGSNGDVYQGEFNPLLSGKWQHHGKGIYFNVDKQGSTYPGMIYFGDFKSNQCHGEGTRTWLKTCKVWEEDWHNKAKIYPQHGVLFAGKPFRYEGKFENDFMQGTGTAYFKDGTQWAGEWKKGMPQIDVKRPHEFADRTNWPTLVLEKRIRDKKSSTLPKNKASGKPPAIYPRNLKAQKLADVRAPAAIHARQEAAQVMEAAGSDAALVKEAAEAAVGLSAQKEAAEDAVVAQDVLSDVHHEASQMVQSAGPHTGMGGPIPRGSMSVFTYAELAEATQSFSDAAEVRLGSGGFGSVFRASGVRDFGELAVKRLTSDSLQGQVCLAGQPAGVVARCKGGC
eukprot:2368728-Rhodomonas_salina.3